MAEVLGEHGLAEAGLAAKEYVVAAPDEVQDQEALDEGRSIFRGCAQSKRSMGLNRPR